MAQIEVIAAHQLKIPKGGPVSVSYVGAAKAGEFGSKAVDGLRDYIDTLDGADETGTKVRPAWWNGGAKPKALADLESCPASGFDGASREAMDRLRRETPGTASPGVVLFLRGIRDGGTPFVALLKMSPVSVDHTQFKPEQPASKAITVAHLENVLPEPKHLRKAAIMPNPAGPPLRVVDERPDPAEYWMNFLGASRPPGQKVVAAKLVTTTAQALEEQGVEQDKALEIVAEGIEVASKEDGSVKPRAFVDAVAKQAKKDAGLAWSQIVKADADLGRPHVAVQPAILLDLTRRIDLGGRVVIAGPASEVDRRAEIGEDASGWYVKVRATQKPESHTS